MYKQISLIGALISSAAILPAQEVILLDEITLSASLDETEVDKTGAQVVVLDEDDLAKAQSNTMAETLGNLPGVSISRSGGVGTNASVVIRGSKPYENKVLIDGFDLADPSAPQEYYNFGTTLGFGSGRIEVLKGSQSAVYGSGASGGVISISNFGEIKDGWNTKGELEYGSYETYSESLKFTYGGDAVKAGLALKALDTKGFSAADENDGATEADGSKIRNAALFLSYDASNGITFGLNGLWEDSEYEYDFASGDADNLGLKDVSAGRVFMKYDDGSIKHDLNIAVVNSSRADVSAWGKYGYETKRITAKYQSKYQVHDNISVNFGLERQNTESIGVDGNAGTEFDRRVNSTYAGVEFSPTENFDIDIIGRYDEDNRIGGQESGRLALSWRPAESVVVKSSLSTGYRAPSLYELFATYGGNPNLKSERTLSFDIGIEAEVAENANLGVAFFSTNTQGYIEYTGSYSNVDGMTKRRGVEITGDYQLGEQFKLTAGYTYTKTEKPNGDPLGRIPEHELNLGVNGETGFGLTYGVQTKFVRNVQDNVSGKISDLDDYNLVDARLGYQLGAGELYLRVENLFDEQYQTASGYGTSDRAYYVGYAFDF